jgi:GGDEF domain-containing protein
MIRRLFTRLRTVTPQRLSGYACRICGNTFAVALPTHNCDELTYLRTAAEWDRRASGGATPCSG